MDEIEHYKNLGVQSPEKNVFLGGKSQGALLSLYIQLFKLKSPLAGIIMFAGYVVYPLRKLYEKKVEDNIEADIYSDEEAR